MLVLFSYIMITPNIIKFRIVNRRLLDYLGLIKDVQKSNHTLICIIRSSREPFYFGLFEDHTRHLTTFLK